ncbi:MAG: tyrosine--tRNA ligase [Candidatus Izemoplasmataceae bacterium]
MTVIEELRKRGLIYALTDEALEDVLQNEKVTFYLGADPTGDSLHVGHLVAYLVARRLSAYGHKPILLVGGGTGLIGDPSGKNTERPLQDMKTIQSNVEKLRAQVLKILPGADVVNNYDWLKDMDIFTFLRDIGKHFNLNQMLAKDSVKSRLESGISFTEFSYQIIQSIDFWELYRREQCTMQIGGQDQWGNITAGLELIRKKEGVEKGAYGLVIPLITKKDGSKFGKSEGGAVWLDPEKTSPYAFYQYWINLEDDEAMVRLKQFTELSFETINEINSAMADTPHLRHAQKALAEEMTSLIHGEKGLNQAKNITDALFRNTIGTLTPEEIEMGFEGLPTMKADDSLGLVQALVETGLASSKREARTMIKQNAISVNGEKINDTEAFIEKADALHERYTVLRRGKKHYALIKHE